MTILGDFRQAASLNIYLDDTSLPVVEHDSRSALVTLPDAVAYGSVTATGRSASGEDLLSNRLQLTVFKFNGILTRSYHQADANYDDSTTISGVVRGWVDPNGSPQSLNITQSASGTAMADGSQGDPKIVQNIYHMGNTDLQSTANLVPDNQFFAKIATQDNNQKAVLSMGAIIKDGVNHTFIGPGTNQQSKVSFLASAKTPPVPFSLASGARFNDDLPTTDLAEEPAYFQAARSLYRIHLDISFDPPLGRKSELTAKPAVQPRQ